MTLRRRRFVQMALSAAVAPALARKAMAEVYPARPVRLVVEVAAGGSPDIIARLLAQWLSERLGQPFVVENRAGAAGNIATEYVSKAVPDGYTLLLSMSANAINTTVYQNLPFNFIRDLAPVSSIGTIPLIMEVNPSIPAKTVPEFIAYAKANPGKINMASGGTGSPLHVAGELFKMMAGVNMIHVPYRSEALALPDLIGGQVQIMFGVMPASLGYVRSGKLRALAVTSAKRQPELPDVPALSEFLPGYEANGWYGVSAPKDTPPQIIETLNKQINASLADPKVRQHLTELGCGVFAGSPADFEKFIVSETDKWAKVVQFAGVKAD
ncbi:MAG TPA: tripartite tricarboxylate transporter substrate binding protein [Xanthobacteraceae bacterium]|nr:tripartite tricarboxylate transporter substrate binding protein [Xanthobacteraceae bacterium]